MTEDYKDLAEIIDDPCRWATTFLRDPENFDGEDYGPLELYYVQKIILTSKNRKNIIRVHRRSGKTYCLAMLALWSVLTNESNQVLIICPTKAQVMAIFKNIDDFIRVSPGFQESLTEHPNSPYMERKFSNGSIITGFTAGSSNRGEGKAIRGRTADMVIVDEAAFLKEEDWKAITPIMYGDSKRTVTCYVSSTPISERNTFYRWCVEEDPTDDKWFRVFVPVTDNPDFSKSKMDRIRADETEATWEQEWLCKFPDVGEGVFKRSYIDRAEKIYSYFTKEQVDTNGFWLPPAVRAMGVDWDKYQAGPSIVIVEADQEHGQYRIIYSEEIPKHKYVLSEAVERIIFLDERFNCSYIYVDRGMAELQVEQLHLYGKKTPSSKLDEKVVGVSFSEYVEVLDPSTSGEKALIVKKPIKPYMVNLLVKMFEDDKFAYSVDDKNLKTQLENYKVKSQSSKTIQYSSDNEHFIDAVMLAVYAIYSNYDDPLKPTGAYKWYLVELPKPEPYKFNDGLIRLQTDQRITRRNMGRHLIPEGLFNEEITYRRSSF